MRSCASSRLIAATLIASSFVCAAAAAGELLVLPYACRVVGGEPVLTPEHDQGYRIIGRREERDFTACSPANPDMCRRWKLYRFDVDCGGQRVPWLSLSAAADAHSGGRSWVENGHMHLEMPPRWGMSPDDPCARRARFGWRYGPLSRHCAERRAATPSDVEMPAGFAPMLELDAIFVADGAPTSERGWAPVPVATEQSAPKPSRTEAPAPRAAEKPARAPVEPPVAKSTSVPTPSETKKAPPSAPATETTTAAGSPSAPTIINRPDAPSGQADSTPVASAAPETTSALPGGGEAPAAAEEKDKPVVVAENDARGELAPFAVEAQPAQEGPAKSISVTLVDELSKSISPALLGLGGVTMLGLLALLFAYRRDQANSGFTPARDIAAVSLDGRSGGRGLVRSGRSLATAASQGGSQPSPAPQRPGPPASFGNAIPQTRAEALEVLGMGVAPEVGNAAIKKIIDGLRLSWHPDYATGAEDRELRELRMKQINAAWEIITGKRAG